eukprot:s6858_g1.t1
MARAESLVGRERALHSGLHPDLRTVLAGKNTMDTLVNDFLLVKGLGPELDEVRSGFELVGPANCSGAFPMACKPPQQSVGKLMQQALWRRKNTVSKCKPTGRRVLVFIDNNGVRDSLIKGSSPLPDHFVMLSMIAWVARRFHLTLWSRAKEAAEELGGSLVDPLALDDDLVNGLLSKRSFMDLCQGAGSIPPKEKEKGEKVEKKVEEDPPSIHKDADKSDKSISSKDTPKDATPPGAGPSIPGDAASASTADPSIATPPPTTLPSVRKPNIDPEDRDEEWDDNSWNQSWGGGWSWHYHQ